MVCVLCVQSQSLTLPIFLEISQAVVNKSVLDYKVQLCNLREDLMSVRKGERKKAKSVTLVNAID